MDMFKYLIYAIAAPLIVYAFNVEILIYKGNFEFFWLMILIYGPTIITFSYVFSFGFKEASNA